MERRRMARAERQGRAANAESREKLDGTGKRIR
jgi:hypothetical protein